MYNVTKLLTQPNRKKYFGQTALHLSVRLGDFQLTQLLIQKGALVNVIDAFENTPLSLACIEKPSTAIAELLIQNGADVNFQRNLHMDLFLDCVLNCRTQEHLEIVKLLINQGININMTEKISNRNCMHYVAINGNLELATLLLQNGAIFNIRDNFGTTPEDLATTFDNEKILILFWEFFKAN